MSRISLRTTGSSPLVASSKISSFGWCESAVASASFAVMPLENFLYGLSSGSEKLRQYAENSSLSQSGCKRAITAEISFARITGEKKLPSSTTPRSRPTAARSATGFFPSTEIVPLSMCRRPRIDLMVVVLPAPFSPIKPMMQPLGTLNETSRREKSP